MSNLTVEEILRGRPAPLKERARAASRLQQEEAEREAEKERDSLEADAIEIMRDVLQFTESEIADVSFKRGPSSPPRQQVSWETDGIHFRVRYENKKVIEHAASQFQGAVVWELVPYLEAGKMSMGGQITWRRIASLAALGAFI